VKYKRKICVVLVDRANYGRMWPVMKAIKEHPSLDLLTICSGTMLLDRFGKSKKIVEKDGFKIDGKVYMELEGSNPTTMAKSVGFGIVEFTSELQRLQPDILLVIGDRYEALSAVVAAVYQNIKVAHIQGGEVSGSIDESTRHSITKFSHYHFPSTERSKEYIVKMGENPQFVYNVGCPSGDFIKGLNSQLPSDIFNRGELGVDIDPEKDFLLVIFHPVTTEFGNDLHQVEELLDALSRLKMPTVWLWPNIDAGSDHIIKALRGYHEKSNNKWLKLVKNFEPITFQKVLKKCSCAVGNSSSFIRDSTFSGTPVVLVGDRQVGRECDENLIAVESKSEAIYEGVISQLKHGRYAGTNLYGEGKASLQIVEKLATVEYYTQKRLHYIYNN